MNRRLRHYPPILLHGVLLFQLAVQSNDQKLWESAVTLFVLGEPLCLRRPWSCSAEQENWKGFLSNIHQTIRSFTTPILLEAEDPLDKIYRFLSTRQRVPTHQRLKWKHPDQPWLYNQLDKVAVVVFGAHNVQRFRPLLIRLSSTGDELFFPFSVKYSIVHILPSGTCSRSYLSESSEILLIVKLLMPGENLQFSTLLRSSCWSFQTSGYV